MESASQSISGLVFGEPQSLAWPARNGRCSAATRGAWRSTLAATHAAAGAALGAALWARGAPRRQQLEARDANVDPFELELQARARAVLERQQGVPPAAPAREPVAPPPAAPPQGPPPGLPLGAPPLAAPPRPPDAGPWAPLPSPAATGSPAQGRGLPWWLVLGVGAVVVFVLLGCLAAYLIL